jgi:hypothetical protein
MLTSIELAQQCLALAEGERDTGRIIVAHSRLASGWFFHGEPVRAHEHCEQGMALYDFAQHHSLAFIYGLDGCVTCMAIGAWALWYLGYPDQSARKKSGESGVGSEAHPPLHFGLGAGSNVVDALLPWGRRSGVCVSRRSDRFSN